MPAHATAATRTATPVVESSTLSDAQYRRIRGLVRERAGIELGDSKRQLCQTRLLRRLRALGLADFAEYLELLDDPDHAEHRELINAITTNVTAFFREPHHFEMLGGTILPARLARPDRRLRVWSAGCSSGEEPWSIAMTLRATVPEGWNVKLLATDIDTQVLERARAGIYTDEQVAPVPAPHRQRFLERGRGDHEGRWRVADELRPLVTFKQLNLFESWPMKGPFDVIFCRNVIIYFDVESKQRLLRRYHDLLAPGGVLMLGHSESMPTGVDGFTLIGRTAYQRGAR